jgi:hypothetical protein
MLGMDSSVNRSGDLEAVLLTLTPNFYLRRRFLKELSGFLERVLQNRVPGYQKLCTGSQSLIRLVIRHDRFEG